VRCRLYTKVTVAGIMLGEVDFLAGAKAKFDQRIERAKRRARDTAKRTPARYYLKMPKLWMGALHIIEWLSAGDRRTGWDLYNELEPIGIMYQPTFPVRFHPIKSRQEFMAAPDRVQTETVAENRVPLLHIETHGNADGIGPGGDGGGIEWATLRDRLIRLNEITRLNLFVSIAACEGAWVWLPFLRLSCAAGRPSSAGPRTSPC
jgi:hypothetical protein